MKHLLALPMLAASAGVAAPPEPGAAPPAPQDLQIVHAVDRPTRVQLPDRPAAGAGIQGLASVDYLKNDKELTFGTSTYFANSRSYWHMHPQGMMVYVVSGVGWMQVRGRPKQLVSAGDSFWIPPGVWHWHGGTTKTAMTHMFAASTRDGPSKLGEPVSDADFAR